MRFWTKSNRLTSNTTNITGVVRWPWLKDLLMTFIATTFSIVLTFGTAAFIDRRQKAKDKRQMVMYVLYDMNRSIELVEHVDSMLRKGLELQIEVARDTSLFEQKRFFFNHCMPQEHFDNTTAQIFSSNFETLNTLDNVRFVEMISTFYHDRDSYESMIIDSCKNEFLQKSHCWDLQTALEFPYSTYIFMSGLVGESLKEDFQQCKELMGVSDEEFAAFELQKQRQSVSNASADNKKDKFLNELFENDARLESAIEEGKNGGKQSEKWTTTSKTMTTTCRNKSCPKLSQLSSDKGCLSCPSCLQKKQKIALKPNMQKKKTYRYSTGETFEADMEDLKRLLRENQEYLDNYLDLYGSLDDDEYVARGNGFCDRKFSDDFIEGQIEKYRERVAELKGWLTALL